MQAAIVILTWNGKHHLERCLPALMPQARSECQVVVVDNGSQDGSGAWVSQHYPRVTLIRNEANLGFAAAVNQGIWSTQSEFVITLNDDTVVAPGWLAALLETAASDDRIGSCATRMLQAQDPNRYDAAGIQVDRAGIAWNRWYGEPVAAHPLSTPSPVFGPCGGAALYRRSMLDEIGLFDEDFFAYYEDVDLAWRAQRAGWPCLYVPQAELVHVHSATGQRISGFKRYHLGRNKIWTLLKNYPAPLLWRRWPVILAYDLAAMLLGLWQDKNAAALRGRIDALRSWRRMWRKRSQPGVTPVALAPVRMPWRVPRTRPGALPANAPDRRDSNHLQLP